MNTKILLSTLIIATAPLAISAHADDDYEDRIEASVRQDANYSANVQKATKILEDKGYTIKKIKADTYKKSRLAKPVPALQAEAYKGAVEYDIKFTYPDLKIVKERPDN